MGRKGGKCLLLLCLVLALLLAGCERYTKGEERRLVEAGRTLMEDYLAAKVPGGKLLTAQARKEKMVGVAPQYLTEYVRGEYEDADGTWIWCANTQTGQIYTSKHFDRLKELVKDRILNELGLPEEAKVTAFYIPLTTLPHQCEAFGHREEEVRFFRKEDSWNYMKGYEYSHAAFETVGFGDVLPVEFTDVEGFLDSPDRWDLWVEKCEITLPAGVMRQDIAENLPLRFDGIVVEKIILRWEHSEDEIEL